MTTTQQSPTLPTEQEITAVYESLARSEPESLIWRIQKVVEEERPRAVNVTLADIGLLWCFQDALESVGQQVAKHLEDLGKLIVSVDMIRVEQDKP